MNECTGVCGEETQEGPDVHVQAVDGEAEKAQDELRKEKGENTRWFIDWPLGHIHTHQYIQ